MAEGSARRESRRARGIRWFRKRENALLGLLAVCVVLTAFAGYAFNARVRAVVTLPEAAYDSLKALAGGVDWDEYGWQGNLANWLDLLLVMWVLVKASLVVFANAGDVIRAGLRRDHTVMCGLTDEAKVMTEALLLADEKVTVVEPDPANPHITLVRAEGAAVLIGDPGSSTVLRRARIDRASRVVCMSPSDDVNATVAREVERLLPSGAPPTFIHNVSASTWSAILVATHGGVIPFSALASACNDVFLALDLESVSGDAQLAVFGSGSAAEASIVRAAKVWQAVMVRFGRSDALRIRVIGTHAEAFAARVLPLRYEGLDGLCEIEAREVDSYEVAEDVAARSLEGGGDPMAAIVSTECDAANVRLTLALGRALPPAVRIVTVTGARPGVLELVVSADDGLADRIDVVDVRNALNDPGTILGGPREELARLAHEDWLRSQLRSGSRLQASGPLQHWGALPAAFKSSNRDQMAAVFDTMVPSLGATVVPLAEWDARPFEFRDGEVEALARVEHDRWSSERVRSGWRLDASLTERDADRKLTPWLVPYDELPESQKDNDRDAVTRIPVLLARAGFRIQRDGDA